MAARPLQLGLMVAEKSKGRGSRAKGAGCGIDMGLIWIALLSKLRRDFTVSVA